MIYSMQRPERKKFPFPKDQKRSVSRSSVLSRCEDWNRRCRQLPALPLREPRGISATMGARWRVGWHHAMAKRRSSGPRSRITVLGLGFPHVPVCVENFVFGETPELDRALEKRILSDLRLPGGSSTIEVPTSPLVARTCAYAYHCLRLRPDSQASGTTWSNMARSAGAREYR